MPSWLATALDILLLFTTEVISCGMGTANPPPGRNTLENLPPLELPLLNTTLRSNTSYPQNEADSHDLNKRWYSITGQLTHIDPLTAWPTMADIQPACRGSPMGSQRWVRYCFKDQRSMDNLLWILVPAIARWAPAMGYSTLRIEPDIGCGPGNWRCVCGPHTSPDVLVIDDGAAAGKSTATTVGYMPGVQGLMTFSAYDPQAQGLEAQKNYGIATMVHELGTFFQRLPRGLERSASFLLCLLSRTFCGN